jgi:hypothetical protein
MPSTRWSCAPEDTDSLRNPWNCRIVYQGRFVTRYRVTVAPDGSYVGQRLDEPGQIRGCCTSLRGVG